MLIEEKAEPAPGARPLAFDTHFPQPLWTQYLILLAKKSILYYRTPDYTAVSRLKRKTGWLCSRSREISVPYFG